MLLLGSAAQNDLGDDGLPQGKGVTGDARPGTPGVSSFRGAVPAKLMRGILPPSAQGTLRTEWKKISDSLLCSPQTVGPAVNLD